MDKKVMADMFKYICDHDEIRPVMNGIHFDEEKKCCYGSDGHVLVLYKETIPALKGKTISESGDEIEGRYPNVFSVFPEEKPGSFTEVAIDVEQLQKACQWHSRNIDSDDKDVVVINDIGFNIKSLCGLLITIQAVEFQPKLKFSMFGKTRPVLIHSKKMDSIIMPAFYEEEKVDLKRDCGCSMIYSYENFINDYVFNSWKTVDKKKPLDWLDQY